MKKHLTSAAAAIAAAVISSSALAHEPSIEPQAIYRIPASAPKSADYSFGSPRVLQSVTASQAVFAYLTWADVDVYQITLTPADFANGPVIIAASALPPGCFEYQWEYPVTALIGPQAPGPFGPPGLPPKDPSLNLPFAVPAGMGVVFADNPRVFFPDKRELFPLEEESGLGDISWFLPEGLSQDCLLNNQAECDFSNTIAQPVFYPGTYQIVMWNPTRIPTDYTANIGFIETGAPGDPEVEDLIRDNGLLHRSCHEPYPFR
jgi:hypothetical protein